MLLALRPFRIGEQVEVGAIAGRIEEIGLFATRLRAADGVFILAPNSTLWNQPVRNFDRNGVRRNEIAIPLGTGDAELAQRTLLELATRDARVLKEPTPAVLFSQLAGTGVTLTLSYWTNAADHAAAATDLTRSAKSALAERDLALA